MSYAPTVSPRSKSQRVILMAERVMDGGYNGSVRRAAQSPMTASMGISVGAIAHQIRVLDPAAHAARANDRARVAAEVAAAKAAGHLVDIVFVERGGSASAKNALVKITQKLKGITCHFI